MTDSIGPTGKFPRGKLDDSDEGELILGVAADHEAGLVRLNFGTPVAWMAMPPDVAVAFANSIIGKAIELGWEEAKHDR